MVHSLLNHIQGKNGSRWANFIRNRDLDTLMIVAIDAAKYTHKAMVSTFYGDILVPPFEFDASLTGFEKVKNQIQGVKKQYGMQEIVVGIETTGHYYEDLVRRCQTENYQVRILNAATTAEERRALLNWSKTDNLDLLAIIQSIIHGRGTSSPLRSGAVRHLQKLTRAYRSLIHEKTATQNQIRVYMDHISREFQGKSIWINGKRQKVKPFNDLFGKSARYLMRYHLHPSDILSLGEEGLRKLSKRENLKIRDKSIRILLELAKDSISQPKGEVEVEQLLLNQCLDQLDLLDKQIKNLKRKIEDLFVQTEGAIILSIPGVSVITGAELYAEMGDISDYDHAGQLIKMAGTNPIINQSGDRTPTYYKVSKQGRRNFRNAVYQVGQSVAMNNPEMKQRYQAFKDRGKHYRQAYIALGNRIIRLAFSMIKHQTLYRTDQENYTLIDQLNKKLHRANIKLFYEKFVSPNVCQSA